ncbi:hypothetical protein Tco_0967190 [Tanacetum coccineum]
MHLILTGIGDEIYSTIDACKTAHEIWEAIERLQQGKFLNIQDVKTNLFWEFRKVTSHNGETMESYYTRFYKQKNEMIRNNLTVGTMQVNVQFLQQLQPEWSRQKGKEIAKPITPPSESASKEDSDLEQAQKDKEMQKNLALIAKYFKKIYKPTNNNLRTSSNTKNKNVDTTPRYKNYNQTRQFGNQRTMTVAGAKETLGGQEVPTADSGTNSKPLEQNDQNVIECDDERVALANLISNLKLDVNENKMIQKKLKKANTSLTQELTECKSILTETSKTLGNLIVFGIVVYLHFKINRDLLAQKDIDIKEGLKHKAYEILVVKEKHDELVKQSLLTKSHYEGLVKDKIKVIHFKKGIAKYAKVSSTPQKCLDLDSSYFIQEIILL